MAEGEQFFSPPPCGEGSGVGVYRRSPGAIHTHVRAEQAAKRLRREPTFAEKLLWKRLRRLELGGSHFRRQVPIGRYVVDFCCHAGRLIVELDGPVHALFGDEGAEAERTRFLGTRGYRLLRFSNMQAVENTEAVVQRIAFALGGGTPTPGPSPQGGGEQ